MDKKELTNCYPTTFTEEDFNKLWKSDGWKPGDKDETGLMAKSYLLAQLLKDAAIEEVAPGIFNIGTEKEPCYTGYGGLEEFDRVLREKVAKWTNEATPVAELEGE